MQLNVRDVSKLLEVPESTVTRWIKQRGLPSQFVGGQHRFNRVDLMEWAAANRVKVSIEVFDHFEADDEPGPSLVDALEIGGIFHGLKDGDKEGALRSIVRVLPVPDDVDRELLLRLLLIREAAATTAIGDGIALPHIRNPIVLHVPRPLVTLGFLDRPVDFGAVDGKPVHVLFTLICPSQRSHLQTLSRLSYALHDAKFKDVVIGRRPIEEIMKETRRVEAGFTERAARPGT
jgi:nitrogen PTS system EIIA component